MTAEFPHCNSEVLHAPGECIYCDRYPERQKVRAAGKTPFTPNESNGWYGNVARRETEVSTTGPGGVSWQIALHCPACGTWKTTWVQDILVEHRCACGDVKMDVFLGIGT